MCPRCATVYPDDRTKCPRHLVTLIPVEPDAPTDAADPAGPPPAGPIPDAAEAPDLECPNCGGISLAGSPVCDFCEVPFGPGCPRLVGPWGELRLDGAEPLQLGRQSPTGRIADALRDRDGVSRFHAEVLLRDGEASLRDLGSLNGTFVNDRRLDRDTPVTLAPGDRIRLGSSVHVEFGGLHG